MKKAKGRPKAFSAKVGAGPRSGEPWCIKETLQCRLSHPTPLAKRMHGSTGWRVVNQRWPLIHRHAFSCAPIGFDQRVHTIRGKGQACVDCVVSIILNMPSFVSMCCYASPVHPKGFFEK